MPEVTWTKHQSGVLCCREKRNGKLLYQIQGSDDWIDEEIPRSISQVNIIAETAGRQGPLRAPGPLDSRASPAERDAQEIQYREAQTSENYEHRSRDGRPLKGSIPLAQRGSTHRTGHGTTSTLVSRTKSADTGIVSQSPSRLLDPRDLPAPLNPALSSHLSVLARSFVSLELGNYLECSNFITDNPKILDKSEIDALVVEAAAAERAGQSTRAQTCIHQALLLRRCNEVGPNKVGLFLRDLNAKDRRVKESFVNDVKKEYSSIQQRAGRTSDQKQVPSPDSRGQKPAVILQPILSAVSQKSYASTQDSKENTQSPMPEASGEDGRLYRTDTRRNLLHSASSHRDSEDYRPQSDSTDLSENISVDPSETSMVNGRDRNNAGRVYHPAASDPPRPLPTLPEHHRYESTRIGGTTGNVETLDQRYRLRKNATGFFERGRVFALLWHESAGGGGGANGQRRQTELSDPTPFRGRYGQEVYSHIRRMVVVKEGHGFCLCLPINTYNGKGITKSGLSEGDRQSHSIVHMADKEPYCLPAEERDLRISKAIVVEKASADQKLDPMSRLNFNKIYTIEHNVKVMNVGKVTGKSLPVLIGYWRKSLE